MIDKSIQRLQYLASAMPALLTNISEDEFSNKTASGKWSKKEILGHLIDSATNNHQRFIRVQFENIPMIVYDQNQWNKYSYHTQMSKTQLITFWTAYNRQLVELIKLIPKDRLLRECSIGKERNVTLQWLIDDYLRHMEHHLKQIVDYD